MNKTFRAVTIVVALLRAAGLALLTFFALALAAECQPGLPSPSLSSWGTVAVVVAVLSALPTVSSKDAPSLLLRASPPLGLVALATFAVSCIELTRRHHGLCAPVAPRGHSDMPTADVFELYFRVVAIGGSVVAVAVAAVVFVVALFWRRARRNRARVGNDPSTAM